MRQMMSIQDDKMGIDYSGTDNDSDNDDDEDDLNEKAKVMPDAMQIEAVQKLMIADEPKKYRQHKTVNEAVLRREVEMSQLTQTRKETRCIKSKLNMPDLGKRRG